MAGSLTDMSDATGREPEPLSSALLWRSPRIRLLRRSVRPVDIDAGSNPAHLRADEAWATAAEMTGKEPWFYTEPQLGLDGKPEG